MDYRARAAEARRLEFYYRQEDLLEQGKTMAAAMSEGMSKGRRPRAGKGPAVGREAPAPVATTPPPGGRP